MKRIDAYWSTLNPVSLMLLPLSLLFCLIVSIRRGLYRLGILTRHGSACPVIVVGNLSVGGTGKTPLVIWLVQRLQQLGYRPGIVSRGYGGDSPHWPLHVTRDSRAEQVGDEPLLIARRTGCPVCVGPDRVAAIKALLDTHECDILISDDGLQHYAMARQVEIVVIDGQRRFGNGLCLPAGPLRERPGRLARADLVIYNGDAPSERAHSMRLEPRVLFRVSDPATRREITRFSGTPVHAVAGIGHPARFFETLRALGLEIIEHPFPDHHRFSAGDFSAFSNETVIMTEKDAVKCDSFASSDFWALAIDARPDKSFQQAVAASLRGIDNG